MTKRLIQAALVLVVLFAVGSAHAQTATATPTATPTPVVANGGQATCVTVTTAQTQVLPAFDLGGKARKRLCLQNVGTANYAACNVGNTTAVTISTGLILPAQSSTSALTVPPFCFGDARYSSQTFVTAPSGAVNCIAQAASTVVCALDY